ncbi:hypothetical protein BH20VER1_BH20VER1_11090 [soil metagenome]
MLGFGKKKPVTEYDAEGEIERVYHEIRQVLRVSGVNLNFRTWAMFEKFLPAMWDAMRPNLETRAFESGADRVRSEAVTAASQMPRLNALETVRLGESQRYQVQAALDLYHYVNPKLLVLTSAVRLALDGERLGGPTGQKVEQLERGEPPRMSPMEMVAAEPDDERLGNFFRDIEKTLGLSPINSDYRTLALWPDYLDAAWTKLKPLIGEHSYQQAADALRETARNAARELPFGVELSRERLTELGEDVEEVVAKTQKFEEILPPLILNIALFQLDWKPAETLRESPFPAATRETATPAEVSR